MHIYEVSTFEGAESKYARTRGQVREKLRTVGKDQRYNVRVILRKVPHDIEAVVNLYNGIRAEGEVLKRFRVTLRGALVQLAAGED